jgi:hypothetical protein
MKIRTNTMIKALAMSWTLALTACGGGGDGGTTAVPATSAEGLWNGNTSTSRTLTSVVLDDGTYWILPVPTTSAPNASFIQGTGASVNGVFSSSDGMDFNLAGSVINQATLSANYVAKRSFNGSVNYPSLNSPFTFTGSYNADYEQAPNLAAVAGNYPGVISMTGSNDATTLVVSIDGTVLGVGATNGCQFLGKMAPRSRGNLYVLVGAFSGGACANNASAVSGIGYFDASAKRLHLAAFDQSRSNGFSFVGIKI